MSTLIKNGNIITSSDNFIGDIFIEGETISVIGKNFNFEANEIIDATGQMIFPGGLDPHVHLSVTFKGTVCHATEETGRDEALWW